MGTERYLGVTPYCIDPPQTEFFCHFIFLPFLTDEPIETAPVHE
jgi:hypothetical protein